LWRIKCDVADVQCRLHIKRKFQSTFYKQSIIKLAQNS
jgi:hypothetical protein